LQAGMSNPFLHKQHFSCGKNGGAGFFGIFFGAAHRYILERTWPGDVIEQALSTPYLQTSMYVRKSPAPLVLFFDSASLPVRSEIRPHMPLRLLLVLGALSAFGPLAIDFYLPSFPALARDFATDVEHVQQSLAVYFIGLALGQ